jgi:putative DNA primase/helicase
LSDVPARQLNWLWPGRIPTGKVSLLCGDPGLGKSLVTLDIAARVTRGGGWPDSELPAERGTVLLFTAEDDAADTVAPRLVAAGADLGRVQIVDGLEAAESDSLHSFSLGMHLSELDDALAGLVDARLVVIDPITAYLEGVHEMRSTNVRRMLRGVTEIAERRRVAVLAITHLSKRGVGPASLRALDSLAFAAAARSVWLVAQDPAQPTRRLMTPAKTNLAAGIGGLSYTIESIEGQPRIAWNAERVEIAADDLVRLWTIWCACRVSHCANLRSGWHKRRAMRSWPGCASN